MSKTLTKREAISYLGLDEKTFDNYFRTAAEFPCLARNGGKGRFYFDEDTLQRWKDSWAWRTIDLNREDYALCLDFALAQHFRSYVLSDFGTGRQREFGQKITNWVKGQLGEVAVKKFLKREFNLDIELDFEIRDDIVFQDIIGIMENGIQRTPKIGIGIKSSKPKNAFLILGENEITISQRRSDIYVYSRPNIPDDHLLRLTKDAVNAAVKGKPHYSKYKDLMPDFANIPCEVAGWCAYSDLRKVDSIPGQVFDGFRYVIESGHLKKTKEDWLELIQQL